MMRTSAFSLRLKMMLLLLGTALFWLAPAAHCQTNHIRFATVTWEPYYGPNLLNQGYVADITREAFRRVGYTIQIDFVPWKRALHDAKIGYYNGVLGLYHSEERARWMTYSKPIAAVQLVFFSKKGRGITWDSLEDLKPYTIGIEREYVYTDAFDHAAFLKKEPVRKVELNLNKLIEKRIDLVAASRSVFLHYIKTSHPGMLPQIEVLPKPLSEQYIYNGFPKHDPGHMNTAASFNRGLDLIKADGTYDKILKRHGLK